MQSPKRFLGIFGQDPTVSKVARCDLSGFLYEFRVYSRDSSRMMGKSIESWNFNR